MLFELPSFKVANLRLKNSRNNHIFVGIASPCDVITR